MYIFENGYLYTTKKVRSMIVNGKENFPLLLEEGINYKGIYKFKYSLLRNNKGGING